MLIDAMTGYTVLAINYGSLPEVRPPLIGAPVSLRKKSVWQKSLRVSWEVT